MSKRRTIDPRIRASETFACLTYRQRDLWIGLILVCDDQGRLPGQAAYVRSAVWPYDDIQLADVDADLAALESLGNILRYRVDGRTYIQLVNWHKYQADAEWLGLSDYPAPEGWLDHARYHGKAGKILTLNWEDRNLVSTLIQGRGKVDEVKAQNCGLPCRDDDVNVKGDDEVDGKVEGEVETAQAATAADAPPVFCGPSTLEEGRKIQGRIRMAYSALIGKVTPLLETDISEAIYKYPEDWIMDSIQIAARKGVKTWAYIRGILNKKAEAAQGAITAADYAAFVER